MINRFCYFFVVIVLVMASDFAHAKRTIFYYGDGQLVAYGNVFEPQSCDVLKNGLPSYMSDGASCSGISEAMKVPGGGSFTFKTKDYGSSNVRLTITGECTQGTASDTVEVLAGYGNPTTHQISQVLSDPAPWSQHGCMVRIKQETQCYAKSGDSEVAVGVKRIYCSATTEETGEDGGETGQPTQDPTPYNGGANPGGGTTDPGTGTNPGGGTTNPGGGTTNPGGGTTNPGGGTTNPGGGTTDPGTGTNPGSGSGGSGDLCQRNPSLNICKNSSATVSCGAAVYCDGDAIQCAMLRQVAEQNCRDIQDAQAANESGIGKLGKQVLDGQDPKSDDLPTPENGTEVNVPKTLDQSGWLGGGQCFADKSFTIQGREVVIPFSRACSALIVLRYAIMIVALMVSFKLLSGAVIRE
ncbi:virulence factor TspB C-terminal domain-related protein [Duganella caerulea]|uniref:virulence factor TspB C-terminal domain-related protein n=1 Tax=Duganella caerulea TaxID=2885762 RepID=UPI004037C17D